MYYQHASIIFTSQWPPECWTSATPNDIGIGRSQHSNISSHNNTERTFSNSIIYEVLTSREVPKSGQQEIAGSTAPTSSHAHSHSSKRSASATERCSTSEGMDTVHSPKVVIAASATVGKNKIFGHRNYKIYLLHESMMQAGEKTQHSTGQYMTMVHAYHKVSIDQIASIDSTPLTTCDHNSIEKAQCA